MARHNNYYKNMALTYDFLTHEQWKQYKDTTYWISNQGRIQNRKFKNYPFLSGYMWKKHMVVKMRIDGKSVVNFFSRMVYETFKGPIPEGYYVNHKNGLPHDNSLQNLELLTPYESGKKHGGKSREAKWFKDLKTGKIVRGERELGKLLGCSYQTINNINQGKRAMYPYDYIEIDRKDKYNHEMDINE